MSPAAPPAPYTLRAIQQMLALPRHVIVGLIEAGFVAPTRGPRNEHRFSFQDVVLLRTAYELRAAHIPSRRMLHSLRQLKSRLPQALPLSGLRIRAVGNDVVVREADAQWEAGSGQLLLDLEVAPAGEGTVAFLRRAGAGVGTPVGAAQWFALGEQHEAQDPVRAEQAYREVLRLAPGHEAAYLNLGAMLCERGRCDEAVALYDAAVVHCPRSALVHFNRAIALEDGRREHDALASYERCLALAPEMADAHFNAARLHDRLGHAQAALRHYSAYRRLQAGDR